MNFLEGSQILLRVKFQFPKETMGATREVSSEVAQEGGVHNVFLENSLTELSEESLKKLSKEIF